MTIFGTEALGIRDIYLKTLRLCLAVSGKDCTPAGVKNYSVVDRADATTDVGARNCAIAPDTGEGLDYPNQDDSDDLDAASYARDVADLIGPLSTGDLVAPPTKGPGSGPIFLRIGGSCLEVFRLGLHGDGDQAIVTK